VYTQLGGIALGMRVILLIAATILALMFTVLWARKGLKEREVADVLASAPATCGRRAHPKNTRRPYRQSAPQPARTTRPPAT